MAKNIIQVRKSGEKFFTVLSNNKLSFPNSQYFSVDEIYDLHYQTGVYSVENFKNKTFHSSPV
ncbi:MAG: hypothetical protein LF885_05020 [Rickettsia endosymbiont of Culicoides impunctatus]|uniref:hypothetical protein n=1 Tax=unclassified Candidatus Tisiphia TaxID=2996318 RepID=UPI001E76156C|nr:hypothetical protein [Rickettsia endosymbiont of Platyusa sonomae]UCM85351.1 MAG: hypothetical protein LF885_05020 [Rickettsia endosymbiont of Culicoides impunctatus]